jgi:hypothetical protein
MELRTPNKECNIEVAAYKQNKKLEGKLIQTTQSKQGTAPLKVWSCCFK